MAARQSDIRFEQPLAVVEAVLQVIVNLDHGIEALDDHRFDCFELPLGLTEMATLRIVQIALGFDAQLGSVGCEVSKYAIANEYRNRDHVASVDGLFVNSIGIHVEVITQDPVLGRAGGTLGKRLC